jgi:prophage regulatory protein
VADATEFLEIFMQKLIQEALAHKREVLLRKREVLRMTGLSNSSFYNRIRDGIIKPGVPIGPRIKGWPASEIEAYIRSCIAKRDGNAEGGAT